VFLLRLDVSTKRIQNITVTESMVVLGPEHARLPRPSLVEEQRDRVDALIVQALARAGTVESREGRYGLNCHEARVAETGRETCRGAPDAPTRVGASGVRGD